MRRYTRLEDLDPATTVVGIDEVGIGPLAGPMIACAVVFEAGHTPIPGVTDSKALSRNQLFKLREQVLDECLDFGMGIVRAKEIDQAGHGRSHGEVLSRAFHDLCDASFGHIYIDGTRHVPSKGLRSAEKLAKADSLIWIVGAASIIAKVEQIYWMETFAHDRWPYYGFDQHRGYGTTQHLMALQDHGPCPIHRRSTKPVRKAMSPTRSRSRWR